VICESLNHIGKTGKISSSSPMFIVCDTCYWCVTCVDKTRMSKYLNTIVYNVVPIILSYPAFLKHITIYLPLIVARNRIEF